MSRSAVIDSIKVVASQVIVLHHLSLYAPMADWMAMAWPRLMAFLMEDGRLAVQPFLVIGGFLAAQSLSKRSDQALTRVIWQRYLRLAPPMLVALSLVLLATLSLGEELSHEDWLSPLPSPGAFLAHLFFLQDVLGIPSLSAGAWYVAIDLQLFGLFACLAHFARRSERPLSGSFAPWVVAASTVTSIHIFSRNAALDVWAIYYLSAYGLGALVVWARESARARICWWITGLLLLIDWVSDPRPRPVLALVTALALYGSSHIRWQSALPALRKSVQYLSDISYSVFVSHFAVIIVVSGLWEKLDLEGVRTAWAATAMAWLACLTVGMLVQRLCERSMQPMRAAH